MAWSNTYSYRVLVSLDQLDLDYGSMTAALWQICKEQQDIIDNMTSRLEALEDK